MGERMTKCVAHGWVEFLNAQNTLNWPMCSTPINNYVCVCVCVCVCGLLSCDSTPICKKCWVYLHTFTHFLTILNAPGL